MTRFAIDKTVLTREPVISVDAGLPVGGHRFRLVVSDDSDRSSMPTEVVVLVSGARLTPGLAVLGSARQVHPADAPAKAVPPAETVPTVETAQQARAPKRPREGPP